MKISKICALVLALAMILPFVVSCGGGQSGTPITFSNVTITSTYDPDAAAATGEESADYEEEIFAGEVVAYVETETAEITVLDVIYAYGDAQNVAVVFDEGTNRVTKIGDLGAGGGYFWNYTVNGADANLGTVVSPDDTIQITFTK